MWDRFFLKLSSFYWSLSLTQFRTRVELITRSCWFSLLTIISFHSSQLQCLSDICRVHLLVLQLAKWYANFSIIWGLTKLKYLSLLFSIIFLSIFIPLLLFWLRSLQKLFHESDTINSQRLAANSHLISVSEFVCRFGLNKL